MDENRVAGTGRNLGGKAQELLAGQQETPAPQRKGL